MHRPYLDSFSYRYAESQLENERLRRHIKELNTQVANLKWYNSELKNEKTKTEVTSAEHARSLNSRIHELELENSDIKNQSFMKERELSNDVKSLKGKLNESQSRINNLEWLNTELRKEKEGKMKEVNELALEKSKLGTEVYRFTKEIDEKKRLISALESRVNNLSTHNSEKTFQLQQMNKERVDLSTQKAALEARYNTVEQLLQKREEEVMDLTRRKRALLEETITQQQQMKKLNGDLGMLQAENNLNRSKLEETSKRNQSLLNSSYEQSKQLEEKEKKLREYSTYNSILSSEKERLATSLDSTKRLADSLRESNNDLRLDTLKKERQLKQNESLFRDMARERTMQLEEAKNSAIEAERNVSLSKLDPVSPDYTIVENTFNGLKNSTSAIDVSLRVDEAKTRLNSSLNSSSSFSDYYNNKFGSPSSNVQAEIERDLKLYRMEQSLNDSLERLRRNLSPKKY
mmetsp:Transcript_10516/g.15375  ORF Transcript_10516/g.15375 Transcript_10516/m.15375 type:complete len:462 (+) Transcript_10516:55-1440(+)